MGKPTLPFALPVLLAGVVFSVTGRAAPEYELFKVQREKAAVSIDIAGTVTARKTVQLAAQLPGRVSLIAGQEGDRFQTGAVLIRLDDKAWQAKLEAALATREGSLAAIRNADAQWRRELASPQSGSGSAPGGMGMPSMMDQMFANPMQNMMGMRNRGVERRTDIVQHETQLANANTTYKQSEAQIKEIQSILRDTKSVAPFDGVIEQIHVEVGDTVQAGQPLATYSETSGFQVKADVPVRQRPGLVEGMNLTVRLDGRPPGIATPISRIFPVADPNQHTVQIELDLPAGTKATVGQYAEVTVPAIGMSRTSTLMIPRSAVIKKGGLPLVFTVGPDGRSRLRVVRVGETEGDAVAILSGVREDDMVVTNPPPGMRAGVQVLPTQDNTKNQ